MFFGEKHISKKLSVVPPNRLTFAFIPIYEQLCLCCLFESILGQHERTRAKENELRSSITYYRKFSRKETIYFHKLSQATITSIGWGIERLSLYNGDKKIILVDSDSVGYSILMERLNEENIKGIGERIGSKSGEGH